MINNSKTLKPNDTVPIKLTSEGEKAAMHLTQQLNNRSHFFTNKFIEKVKDGNAKALAELTRYALPPTQMDLRTEYNLCVKANVPDDFVFELSNGLSWSMRDLKALVPEWAKIAEMALIKSDPLLADKLMTLVQWNAKSAFEVLFTTATDELKNIKKLNQKSGDHAYYSKWILKPLREAVAQVKAVKPPENSLVGYGNKIPLSEAVRIADQMESEFAKLLKI